MVKENRPVFVEDVEDRDFYTSVLEILLTEGAWTAGARPKFLEAGFKRQGGGWQVVEQLVAKIRSARMDVVRGLIDRDQGNIGADGIVVLDRHSMENYLYDPLVVACVLMESGEEIKLGSGRTMRGGDEYVLRQITDRERDEVAERVITQVESSCALDDLQKERITVPYTFGGSSIIPRWLIDTRGHDLEKMFYGVRKGIVVKEGVKKAFTRAKIVPVSLQSILERSVSAIP